MKTVRMDPVENWIARAESIPHYLRQAIAAKAYGSPCGLIVYLNINECGIRQAETEHAIEAANGCSRELSCSLALLFKTASDRGRKLRGEAGLSVAKSA